MFMDAFDENDIDDDDDDVKEEFLCPFCSEYFDIVGLCCHIDEEHPVEAKNGVSNRSNLFLFSNFSHYLDKYCSIRAWLSSKFKLLVSLSLCSRHQV